MSESTDPELVQLSRNGGREAFGELVNRYWDRVRNWIFSLTHHADQADDLTQEVFFKAWLSLPSLTEDTRFRPWIFKIAKNLVLDGYKGARGAVVQSLPIHEMGPGPNPLMEVMEQEAHKAFLDACDRLPMTYRAAYSLWALEQLDYSEIATMLDITEGNARWRVCKAREFLSETSKPHLD